MHYFPEMSNMHGTRKPAANGLQVDVRVGSFLISAPGFVWAVLGFLLIWAVATTCILLSDAAIAVMSDAALLKAAAILGAFILFASLVNMTERLRWRERQLDAEFERDRHPPA